MKKRKKNSLVIKKTYHLKQGNLALVKGLGKELQFWIDKTKT